jgi:ribosome recycling factor
MEPKDILKMLAADLKKAVDHTLNQFGSLHTGKASPTMLDSVRVNAYGSTVTLKEVAAGGILRVPIPELTGERRQELAKTANNMAEDGRVRVRQARRDALDLFKTAKSDGLSEDDFKRYEKEVQKEHDDFISEINQQLSAKEADLKKV